MAPRDPGAEQTTLFADAPSIATAAPGAPAPARPVASVDPARCAREAALEAVRARIRACIGCPLATQGRRQAVPGEGTIDARVVVIGEAPGADEDARGRPFIGRSGQRLRALLAGSGLPPEAVYITNTNRCRPPANRTPTSAERRACTPHLRAELALLRPHAVVLLGLTATRGLLGAAVGARPLGALRGWVPDALAADAPWAGEPWAPRLFITFHPAAALRSPAWHRALAEDLATVAAAVRAAAW